MFWSSTPVNSCQEGGRHNFESFEIKSIPPTPEQIEAAELDLLSAGDEVDMVRALTTTECIVVCTWCGKKAEQ